MSGVDALSMAEAAARCDVSYDRFRKVWRKWSETLDFPGPFLGDRGANYRWRASAIDHWKERREAALGAGRAAPAVNDNPPPEMLRKHDPRRDRERAELRRLMAGS